MTSATRPWRLAFALAALLACGVQAQVVPPAHAPAHTPADKPAGTHAQDPQVAAERARIAAERTRINARFAQEEKACHQRFAVNDCLNRNLAWQRAELAELRRQEIVLNDDERRRRAAERIDTLDEKAREHQRGLLERPEAEPRQPNAAPRPGGGKLPRSGEGATKADDAQAVRAYQERMERKQERHAENQERRAEQAGQAAQDAARHSERVREAQARKQRILERNAGEPSKAAPLPDPTP